MNLIKIILLAIALVACNGISLPILPTSSKKVKKAALNPVGGDFNDSSSSNINEKAFRELLASKCLSCHGAGNAYNIVDLSRSTAALVADGQIIPGDAFNSKLFYRLQGVGLGKGQEDMPIAGNLSDQERDVVYNYINAVEAVDENADPNKPSMPAIFPAGATFNSPVSVTLNSSSSAYITRYSFNSSINSCMDGNIYTSAFEVSNETTTVYAVNCDADGNMSDLNFAVFSYSVALPSDPQFDKEAQVFTDNLAVMVTTVDGLELRYTLDGSDLNTCDDGISSLSQANLILNQTTTIKAIACTAEKVKSSQVSVTYTKDTIVEVTFEQVQEVLNRSCNLCHTGRSGWNTFSEQDFLSNDPYLNAPLVVKGSPETSPLLTYTVLAPVGEKSMPKGGAQPFSQADYNILQSWIQNSSFE